MAKMMSDGSVVIEWAEIEAVAETVNIGHLIISPGDKVICKDFFKGYAMDSVGSCWRKVQIVWEDGHTSTQVFKRSDIQKQDW